MNISKTTYPENYGTTPEHFNKWAREVADQCEQNSRLPQQNKTKLQAQIRVLKKKLKTEQVKNPYALENKIKYLERELTALKKQENWDNWLAI